MYTIGRTWSWPVMSAPACYTNLNNSDLEWEECKRRMNKVIKTSDIPELVMNVVTPETVDIVQNTATTEKAKKEGSSKKITFVDCLSCKYCKDKVKYGGPGKLKQACELKKKQATETSVSVIAQECLAPHNKRKAEISSGNDFPVCKRQKQVDHGENMYFLRRLPGTPSYVE